MLSTVTMSGPSDADPCSPTTHASKSSLRTEEADLPFRLVEEATVLNLSCTVLNVSASAKSGPLLLCGALLDGGVTTCLVVAAMVGLSGISYALGRYHKGAEAEAETSSDDASSSDGESSETSCELEIEGSYGFIPAPKYRRDKLLGIGGQGEVYEAFSLETLQTVALKCEKPPEERQSRVRTLLKEANFLRALASPWTPLFIEYFTQGDLGFLALELGGDCLGDLVKYEPLSEPFASLVAVQLLRGFEHMHSKGVIHRDTKPDNFLTGRGSRKQWVMICDHGCSAKYFTTQHIPWEYVGELGTEPFQTKSGKMGMSLSRRDDLQALGLSLLHLLHVQPKDRPPAPLASYIQEVMNLEFQERPSYDLLSEIFDEWLGCEVTSSGLEPIAPRPLVSQPDDAFSPRRLTARTKG